MTNSKYAHYLSTTTIVLLVLAVIQLVLGVIVFPLHSKPIAAIHGGFGWLALVATIVAVVFAALAAKEDASLKNILYHTSSLPVLAILNIVLIKVAEASHSRPIAYVHMGVGVVYIAAVVALFFILRKRLAEPTAHAAVTE